ncbi:MAG: hypothetical protein ACM3IJ_05570 [Candidatus Levyibacteriota bacterium]
MRKGFIRSYKILLYESPRFCLEMSATPEKTFLTMEVSRSLVNTRLLPHTHEFLSLHFPNVFNTECFNEQNLPFYIEAAATEMGHLFEHILIEHMRLIKVAEGEKYAEFNGITSWNWEKDPVGVFHIELDAKIEDKKILFLGLKKTIILMEQLFNNTTALNTGYFQHNLAYAFAN